MTLNVEQNLSWARKLNQEMTLCYKKNPDQQLQAMASTDSDLSLLESIIVKSLVDAEAAHDFSKEIKAQEEREKQIELRRIQDKVSNFREMLRGKEQKMLDLS